MIAIIDFGAGNLYSAYHAFKSFYDKVEIIRHAREIDNNISGLVLPGDGSFPAAFHCLKKNGFPQFIRENPQIPLLGICVGFQLLFSSSEENGGSEGLGIIPGEVKKFTLEREKIPHIGWNNCHLIRKSPLITGIQNDSYFYFVHSYFATPLQEKNCIMSCNYGFDFTAAVQKGNTYGCQFHPEKSHDIGWKIIKNFVRLCQD